MATSQANLMQTAINGAATLTSAYIQAGLVSQLDQARDIFDTERKALFEVLSAQPTDAPAAVAATSGGVRSTGGGKQFTADEARAIDLRFGKFKGVTLGELESMSGAEAAEYGYGDGEKTGMQYLKYLANQQDPKASFTRRAAEAVLEARRASAA